MVWKGEKDGALGHKRRKNREMKNLAKRGCDDCKHRYSSHFALHASIWIFFDPSHRSDFKSPSSLKLHRRQLELKAWKWVCLPSSNKAGFQRVFFIEIFP